MPKSSFELTPVSPFRLDLTVWTLRRRPSNVVDRWDGTTYRRVLPLPTGPVEVAVIQESPAETAPLQVSVVGQQIPATARAAVTSALERLLGLSIDLNDFYQFAAHEPHLGPLAERFRGMKPPRFATFFEGAINAMACQQVTLTLGIRLLSDLSTAFGTLFNANAQVIHAFPRPADLAGLSPSDLRMLGFSHQKGQAMIELAQSVEEGLLDLEQLSVLPDDEALINVLERAKILADPPMIGLVDLPQEVIHAEFGPGSTPQSSGGSLAEIEKSHVLEVLKRENGNKARAARALGIDRRSLYRLLEKYQPQSGPSE